MNRFICYAFNALAFIGGYLHATANADVVEKPNVLLIIADDLGDRLGVYGDPLAVTPNLDELASKGVTFGNTFCQFPTCGPSRASMLSGLYPFETGYTRNSTKSFNDAVPGVLSLPAFFREQGYFTARVGKIFHMSVPGGLGKKGGDDDHAWDVAVNNTGYEALDEHWKKATRVGNTHRSSVRVSYDNPEIDDAEMADGQGLSEVVRLLKSKNPTQTGKPFFLAFGIYSPHPPMLVPNTHWEAVDVSNYTQKVVPTSDREDIPNLNWHVSGPGFDFIPDEHALKYTHAYYAAVHFIDDLVGTLLEALEKEGLSENTLIVFTGDQGFHLGEHGHWHKSTMFEEAVRVPLIVVDPRQKEQGKVVTGLAGLIDLYPTLCELADLEPPHRVSGRSLVPHLKEEHAPGKPYEITMGSPGAYGIRTERYRYTEWRKDPAADAESAMLYDLKTDPHEFTNLIDHPEYAEVAKRLRATLQVAVSSTTDK